MTAKINMYFVPPCPKCNSEYRWPKQGGGVQCDDCGYFNPDEKPRTTEGKKMAKLKCETNTREVETDIRECIGAVETVFEHGQWWVRVDGLGTWSVNDCEPGEFCFEQVSGD